MNTAQTYNMAIRTISKPIDVHTYVQSLECICTYVDEGLEEQTHHLDGHGASLLDSAHETFILASEAR